MTRSRIAGVLALALSAWGLACGGVRFSNDPPGFQYLPPEPVRSTMWVLAAEIEELERLLATPEGRASEVQRTAVRSTLARMREAARQLDQPGRSSQHPMLDHNLERLYREQRSDPVGSEPEPPIGAPEPLFRRFR